MNRWWQRPKLSGGLGGTAIGTVVRNNTDIGQALVVNLSSSDTTEATAFTWDVYAFGAGSDLNKDNINLSGLDQTNDFSSPDGLWFGAATNPSGQINPLLWIQTDDGAYTDVTNCMLLAAIPGNVGDGGANAKRTITSVDAAGAAREVATNVGAPLGTDKLRRFLVGPADCEITGLAETPDGRTLFVNIQHPGETPSDRSDPAQPRRFSNWPDYRPDGRPRSATVVIRCKDGGVIGA